ncbi:hypothetical protein [Brevibacterium casei]|uniref:DUF559 domain-containing protein n=3 Tax=Brevibacterium casei TaxID=33889 RepID=A0A2H1JLL1_9MICO|nr:hypothetical protein [Brevibacterium casei]MCT1550204.1 hypothetical protein [Brevibacterium casei]MCT1560338.1 hypothetical protein [Brevibacterium casei]MCT2208307.1 hypothetical protein [Brevibacterium casei]SMX88396.1 hypothetical protein BC102111_02414 [Brevibacterium casei CIP 102111]VEW14655.1 Uncharacterised protein [Brevibacterium casei]
MFTPGPWELRDYSPLFRANAAEQRGISRHKLFHSGRYPVVVPGVRMDRESTVAYPTPQWADQSWIDDAQRLRAVGLKYPNVAAGFATAARLFGWPLPRVLQTSELDVCSDDMNMRIRLPGVRLHRTKVFVACEYFDLPVVIPLYVFVALGPALSLHDLVRLGDAAVGNWHGPPQIDLDRLRAYVSETRGIRSRRHLLDALALVRPTVDSPRETDLRLWARSVGLPEPTVHPRIFCPSIDRVVEPDLGYENEKLALEYDGDHHRTSKDQWNRDITRDEAMRLEGWTVFRVTGRTNYRQLEEKIRHHLGLS